MRRTILSFAILLLTALSCMARDRDRFSYVYMRGNDRNATISMGSLEEVLKLRKQFGGTYLWARLDGREYLIRDAATLEEVRRAAAPLQALNPEQEALRRKMKPFEDREERLDRELDALTDDDDDDGERSAATEARIRELRSQMREVRNQLRDYEREDSRLDRREEELDRVFDAEVRRIVERAIRNGVATRP